MRYFVYVCAVAIVFIGCKGSEPLDPQMDKLGRATGPVEPGAMSHGMGKGMPPGMGKGMPPGMARGMPSGSSKVHAGTVLEAISASRYTYVHLKPASGQPVWAAIPQTKLEIGATVRIVESITMSNFESPSLKRTFPAVVFGMLEGQAPPAGMMGGKPGGGMMGGKPGGMPPGHPPIDRNAQGSAKAAPPDIGTPAGKAPADVKPAQ